MRMAKLQIQLKYSVLFTDRGPFIIYTQPGLVPKRYGLGNKFLTSSWVG